VGRPEAEEALPHLLEVAGRVGNPHLRMGQRE
jgi:hypothetical protein